jgi:hypothetical protein
VLGSVAEWGLLEFAGVSARDRADVQVAALPAGPAALLMRRASDHPGAMTACAAVLTRPFPAACGVLSGRRGDSTPHAAAGRADPRADDAARRLRHVGLAQLLAPEHCRVASHSRPLRTCSSFRPSYHGPTHKQKTRATNLQVTAKVIPSTSFFPHGSPAGKPGLSLDDLILQRYQVHFFLYQDETS